MSYDVRYAKHHQPSSTVLAIAGQGMKVQSDRLKTIGENVANAGAASTSPNEDPYRRKVLVVERYFDPRVNAWLIRSKKVIPDKATPFRIENRPGDPGADSNGNVKISNVNSLMEMMDMREAQRSHEANMKVYEAETIRCKGVIDLLR